MPLDGRASRARVCIVTPTPIGSTPRVVKEAEALHEADVDVTVIAVRTLAGVEPRDVAALRDAAWRTVRIDLRTRWRRMPARVAQLAARGAAKYVASPRLAERALHAFTPRLTEAAMASPADLFIAHYPAALPAVAAAARTHGARFAFDAEDFHPGEWPDGPRYDRERHLLGQVERRYLPHAVHVTAASPGIADAYAEAYGIRRPQVVLNTFAPEFLSASPVARKRTVPGPSVYWFSQVIGPGRGLDCAVRAIGQAAKRPHLHLRGTPARGYVEELRRLAREAGAADRVHVLAPGAPDDMVRLATAHDVGLVAEPAGTRNSGLALANKLFTYLAAGVPPLMSDTPAHRALAAEAGIGDWLFPVDDHRALAARLDALLEDEERLQTARARTRQLAGARYDWAIDRRVLLATVMASLSGGTDGTDADSATARAAG